LSITYQKIQELILLCKQKNHKAQCEVYNRIVKDAHYTEDGIQDGFLKAFSMINDNKQKVSFGACLNRIVVNPSTDFKKKINLKQKILIPHIIKLRKQKLMAQIIVLSTI
jgi:RNA polymerase sigma-70 factor (ECF subfamily)